MRCCQRTRLIFWGVQAGSRAAEDIENLSGHLKSGQRGWAGTVMFYPFPVGPGKSVLVRQLRDPHFRMWP